MLRKVFGFLNAAPEVPIITDEEKMRSDYRYWRLRVMYSIIVGYIGFYFVRKSISTAIPVIIEEFDIPRAQMGMVLTMFGLTYGISKFINGFAGDRTNPRYFMAMGLVCAAVINIFFGLSNGIIAFGIFWILNGLFQGMGWAPCSKTLVHWFSAKERGFKWSIANSAISIGAAGVMFLNGYLIKYYGWRYCFFVPAGIAFCVVLFILNRLRDRPQSLGLPPVEQYTGEEPDPGDTKKGKDAAYKQMVKQYIFKNPMMWVVCLAQFFVYVIRYSVLDWGTTFLTEDRGVDIMQASWIVAGYELSGLAGMLVAGFAMDKLFKSYGGRTCAIYMALCTLFILIFWKAPIHSVQANALLLCAIGFMIYGPQCLVAVIAVNMAPKNVGAAAVGLTGLFGYASTTVSGVGLGALADNYGWNAVFLMLVIASIMAMIFFIVLWNSNPHLPGSQAHADHENRKNK